MARTKIRTEDITDGEVTSASIADATIVTGDIASATIVTGNIASSTIATGNMAVDPTNASNLSSGSVPLAQLGNAPATDLSGLQDDIAILGFLVASNGSLAKYNLVDQTVDAFESEAGIDTSASTAEVYNSAGKYYSGEDGSFTAVGTHAVTSSGTTTWASGGNNYITALEILGGGGAGGSGFESWGSGGGGAAYLKSANFYVFSQTDHSLVNGAGGDPGTNCQNSTATTYPGEDTVVFENIAGGGKGGRQCGQVSPIGDGGTYTLVNGTLDGSSSAGVDGNRTCGGTSYGYGGNAGNTSFGGTGGAGVANSTAGNDGGVGAGGGGGNSCQSGAYYGGDGGAGKISFDYGYYGAVDITLISNTTSAQAAPTKGDIVFTYTSVFGLTTVGTDVTAEISADGGSTWTAMTLGSEGSTGTHSIATAHDVTITSTITAPYNMAYRIKTLNQSDIATRIHGVSLGWS